MMYHLKSFLTFLALPLAQTAVLKKATSSARTSAASSSSAGTNSTARSLLLRGGGVAHEAYTTNTACLPNYCINPVIPGLMFLGENVLENNKQKKWMCGNIQNTKVLFKLGGFCSRVLAAYPFSIPVPPPQGNDTEASIIQLQSRKALETYVGHMSGMGYDFWDYTKPWAVDNPCIQQVWKMSCYTHFPRCNEINKGTYLPPCRSACENYLSKCQVQCCDEGVQCTFKHATKMPDGSVKYEHGYPDVKGPSPMCTGGWARRSASGAAFAVIVGGLAAISVIQH